MTETSTSSRHRILHLEDSAIDAELVAEFLASDGLAVDITRVWAREDFAREVARDGYELILADHQLPSFDGNSALAIAREIAPQLPFIFVSGTLGEDVAVEALKRGATDYVVKQRLDRLPRVVARALDELREKTKRRGAERALLESERELQIAMKAGRFGAWSLDLQTLELTSSAVFRTNFGGSAEQEISYQQWLEAIHPDDRERIVATVTANVAAGEDCDLEYRIVTPAGRIRWIGVRGQTVYGPDRTPLRMVGISQDIDLRKREEIRRRVLIDLEDRFRVLKDPAELAYVAAEMLGQTFGVSRAGYGTIDPAAETVTIDRDWNAPGIGSVAGTLNLRRYGSFVDDLKQGRTVVFSDAEQDSRTAAVADVLQAASARAILNLPIIEQGQLVAMFFLNHDRPRDWPADEIDFVGEVAARTRAVVERRRAQRDLRESEEHYRFAAELNPQVAWTATPDGQLDRVARRWAEWTGVSGNGDSWGQGLHPDDLPRSIDRWTQSVTTGIPYDIEHRVQMVTGEVRWARSRAFPRRNEAGEIVRWYGATEDIHDQKLLEEALTAFNVELEQRVEARTAELGLAQEALRQSQKLEAMGQLTGGVAHDFNNLLTPIVGSLDMLQRRGIGTDREKRLIEGALQSAERARLLVQRLLAFARRQPLKSGPIDIGALIHGMADLVSSTSGPQIRVIVDAPRDLPPAVADPNQLEMAVLNLCVNARDAMPHGGTLTIAARSELIEPRNADNVEPGRYVLLSVDDTGVGMDVVTLNRAIEPFFSTKGIGKGTGLGLSMVHGLASQLGGAMTIRSRPGQGTQVRLLLPVSDQPLAVVDGSSAAPGEPVGRGTALLVDDEDIVRASTADMLSELGYEVVEASSAEQAIRLMDDGVTFDLLVTDHLMPGMSGVDLARAVQRRKPEAAVLIISGYADAEGIASDLPRLTKPFRQHDLSASIGDQLRKD